MGVYIKGMKMPKSCFECDLYGDENNFCKAQKEYLPFALFGRDYKSANCPLVEVPEPHGRLIDADALVPDICHDWNGWRVPPDDYSEECIRKAPIVIEAEGE